MVVFDWSKYEHYCSGTTGPNWTRGGWYCACSGSEETLNQIVYCCGWI